MNLCLGLSMLDFGVTVQEYLVSGSQTVDFTISGLRSRCRLDAKMGREGTRERERESEREQGGYLDSTIL